MILFLFNVIIVNFSIDNNQNICFIGVLNFGY